MLILVVEDDPNVSRFLVRGLQEEGWTVDLCERGDDALEQGARHPYDLMLLDWRLPGMDGLAVLRGLRHRGVDTPIIMLTARDSLESTVEALNAGADDYLSKPFRFEELLALCRAQTRRNQSHGPALVQIGHAQLDMKLRRLTLRDKEVSLSAREFELLDLLLQHRGEALSRSRILDTVWQVQHDVSTNVVDVYVRYLRAYLDDADTPPAQSIIETVRGVGYRLRTEQELSDVR